MRHNFGKGRIYNICIKSSRNIEISSNVLRDTILISEILKLRGIYVESSSFLKIENNVISNL